MNYLILPEMTEEQKENLQEPIKLTQMIYMFSYADAASDAAKEEGGTLIRSAYSGLDENGKYYVFGTNFLAKDDEPIKRLRTSEYFDFANNNIDRSRLLINFFAASTSWYATDFICTTTNEAGFYKFRALIDENTYGEFIIGERIKLGLEIIHRCFDCSLLTPSIVNDANLWLMNEAGGKDIFGFHNVVDFSIENMSKSIKKGKNLYTGAIAIKFIDDKGESEAAVMAYTRSTKMRDRENTVKLNLMEAIYRDNYNISPFSASVIGTDFIRLIAFKKDTPGYMIFNITTELHSKLSEEIHNL